MNKFLLGTAVCTRGEKSRMEFTALWAANQLRDDLKPQKIVILCEDDHVLSSINPPLPNCSVLPLPGNLGHVGMLMSGEKRHDFTGWAASMSALALLAYMSELDFVYQESDCLLFGPCITQAYRDLSDGLMVFGHAQSTSPHQVCSQSFFVVRHAFIPAFVSFYFSLGPDIQMGNLPEHKFKKLEDTYGVDVVRRLSFGVDRCRPLPWGEACWYAQQLSAEELSEVKRRGLV